MSDFADHRSDRQLGVSFRIQTEIEVDVREGGNARREQQFHLHDVVYQITQIVRGCVRAGEHCALYAHDRVVLADAEAGLHADIGFRLCLHQNRSVAVGDEAVRIAASLLIFQSFDLRAVDRDRFVEHEVLRNEVRMRLDRIDLRCASDFVEEHDRTGTEFYVDG